MNAICTKKAVFSAHQSTFSHKLDKFFIESADIGGAVPDSERERTSNSHVLVARCTARYEGIRLDIGIELDVHG